MAAPVKQHKASSDTDSKMSAEPIGIIISRGSRAEPAPVVWAYVWGPAPKVQHDEKGTRAA